MVLKSDIRGLCRAGVEGFEGSESWVSRSRAPFRGLYWAGVEGSDARGGSKNGPRTSNISQFLTKCAQEAPRGHWVR